MSRNGFYISDIHRDYFSVINLTRHWMSVLLFVKKKKGKKKARRQCLLGHIKENQPKQLKMLTRFLYFFYKGSYCPKRCCFPCKHYRDNPTHCILSALLISGSVHAESLCRNLHPMHWQPFNPLRATP